jgi:hypothetical protein
MEYGSHLSAAEAGCPICKAKLNSMNAEPCSSGWKNQCREPKCLGLLVYTVKYESRIAETPAPAQRRNIPRTDTVAIPTDWEYEEDYNRWRNAEGKVVKLKDLSNEELLDAMYALKEFNFAKRGSTIDWMKDLLGKPGKYLYPADALKVGKNLALAKLEEMREIATDRELFGIST